MSTTRLDAIGRRIEQLTLAPEAVSAPVTGLLSKIFGSFLYRVGWRPRCDVQDITALVDHMNDRDSDRQGKSFAEPEVLLERAIAELDDNLVALERATVIEKRALFGHARWLRRVYEVVVHAQRALALGAMSERLLTDGSTPGDNTPGDRPDGRRVARVVDDALLAPPLSLTGARVIALGKGMVADHTHGAANDDDNDNRPGQPASQPGRADAGPEVGPEPGPMHANSARVLELQLDTIDHLLDAARREYTLFARKRRLLEAARQLLLEVSAALDLDDHGVNARLQSVARQVTRIDRMQALGLSGDIGLLHQARTMLSRGEREPLYAALQAMDDAALTSHDPRDADVAARTGQALADMAGISARAPSISAQESMMRSANEILGPEVVQRIEDGFQAIRADAGFATKIKRAPVVGIDAWMADLFRQHIAPGAEHSVLAAALAVDGCFDLGGAASPVRVKEAHVRRVAVPYPTPTLTLVPAERPDQLADAIISDPRSVILDLAAGRLLARRYLREHIEQRERTRMRAEVRVYVLDGSTSMLGARAYMRDAILIAELCTLMKRMSEEAGTTRLSLFYRYFTKKLGPITRVDSAEAALQAIREIMENPHTGGTDIESALISSMDTVREARELDPELSRAQIVLITDGAAPISEHKVTEAREAIGGSLPVGVSVIALGEENRALRKLVARQRARGERAFYHFQPDAFLAEIARGDMDGDRPLHLPSVPWIQLQAQAGADSAAALDSRLGELLDELADLERARDRDALRELDLADRRRRVEPSSHDVLMLDGEGTRASVEAVHRDHRALARRYTRWFPEPIAATAAAAATVVTTTAVATLAPQLGTIEHQDLESTLVVLATIAEVVELIEDSELARQADAIDLLERMLPDARLSPTRYHAVLESYPRQVAGMLRAVHASVRWGAFWRIEDPDLAGVSTARDAGVSPRR